MSENGSDGGSGSGPGGVASQVAQGVSSAATAASGAANLADDPVAGATDVVSGAAGVASAAGVQEAAVVAEAAEAAGTAIGAAQDMQHDPVGGLLGMAEAGTTAAGAAGAGSQATQAAQSAVSTARGAAGLAQGATAGGAAPSAPQATPARSAAPTRPSADTGAGSGDAAAGGQAAWVAPPAGEEALHATYAFTGGGSDEWTVHKMELVERLDRPYEAILDLSIAEGSVEIEDLLGQRAVFSFSRHDIQRDVQGVIRRIERTATGSRDHLMTLRVSLVPKVWMLSQTLDTRIFQELSTPDILKKVFEGAGLEAGTDFQLDLQGTYLVREYCVQWEETNLDFCLRLMEEEGIWFRFDHSGDVEKLVLGDSAGAFPGHEGQNGDTVNYTVLAQGSGAEEKITALVHGQEVTPNEFVVRGYDWTKPDLKIEGKAELDTTGLEVYRHDPTTMLANYSGTAYGQESSRTQADLLKRRELTKHRATANSDVSTAVAGVRLTLENHPVDAMNQAWLVVGVRHEGRGRSQGEAAGEGSQAEYVNHLELMPASVDWRPARTLWKRRIHSVMTAKVVGPAGEEIHTDVHGRIKVQFHWDRLGKTDDKSSCWIRSMQPWGGEGWGFVFLPRIGMEVVVTFVDGDIDRPLVIGSVYNGKNTPPYALPDDKTKSTIKTNSTPGGNGYNELRFEDAAGEEEVFIHAQKDMNEVVENNHTRSVGADETISVGGNRTKSVDVNETITIKGHQMITINGEGDHASGSVPGGQMKITGKYNLYANDEIIVEAPNKITLKVPGSSIVMEPGKITLTSGGKSQIVIDANILAKSSGNSSVFLDANANVHASGGGDILLDANAVTRSNAGSSVTLDANALVAASTGGQTNLTADAVVSGANATLSGTAASTVSAPTATLQGGAGSVEASASGVSASGPSINIAGAGSTSISGAVVKIN